MAEQHQLAAREVHGCYRQRHLEFSKRARRQVTLDRAAERFGPHQPLNEDAAQRREQPAGNALGAGLHQPVQHFAGVQSGAEPRRNDRSHRGAGVPLGTQPRLRQRANGAHMRRRLRPATRQCGNDPGHPRFIRSRWSRAHS